MKGLDYGSGRKKREGYMSSDFTGSPIFDYMIKDYEVVKAGKGEFDKVHCRNVLHHIPEKDLPLLFDEFYRIIKDGGELIISEPAEEFHFQNKVLDVIWYRFLVKDYEVLLPQDYVDYRAYMDRFKEVSCEREIKNDIRVFKKVG